MRHTTTLLALAFIASGSTVAADMADLSARIDTALAQGGQVYAVAINDGAQCLTDTWDVRREADGEIVFQDPGSARRTRVRLLTDGLEMLALWEGAFDRALRFRLQTPGTAEPYADGATHVLQFFADCGSDGTCTEYPPGGLPDLRLTFSDPFG